MTTKQQSILPFRIEAMPSSDALTSHAGLPLVAETMRALGLEQAAREHLHLQQRNAGLNLAGKIASHAGNLTLRISEATDPNCTKSSPLDAVQ